MGKYSAGFKLKMVTAYLDGKAGYKTLGKTYKVEEGAIRRWVAGYRTHGAEGLKKKTGSYSAEFKLSVLQHMWENRLSYRETAAIFNIRHEGHLSTWERLYRNGGSAGLEPRKRGRRRKSMADPARKSPPLLYPADEQRSREELLAELQHLRMENAYLKKVDALVRARQAPKKRK
jgi:transposase